MEQKLGKVTIAPNVLVTIVQKTSCSVPGVARLSDNVPGVQRLLGLHTAGQGVRVTVADRGTQGPVTGALKLVTVDVYLVARRGFDLLQVGRQLQYDVTRAIEELVGMPVNEVNVHIDDVATELAPKAPSMAPHSRREMAA
ncbi:MAG: Asp23/Gls24 family envelope stress response protein [Anaerolineae bacterium]|nr:Asp23/Gls24 family envelope stress response protein [Anaerolineae bacterium]